jgi:hypothetical protein
MDAIRSLQIRLGEVPEQTQLPCDERADVVGNPIQAVRHVAKVRQGLVSVHVVGTRNTCEPIPRSRNIAAHERQAAIFPGAVGPNPSRRPALHRGSRSPSGSVGEYGAALGGDGPAHDRASAAELP